MTLLISCQEVSKSFGAQPLFSNISIGFYADERLGLIGPNGSGKSTLLKILAGVEHLDSGELSIKRGTNLVYLPQEDLFDENQTIEQAMMTVLDGLELEDADRYTRLQMILGRAEFLDLEQKVGNLSGGWKKRLAICRALVQNPDILLLDEPTNHLDLEGILWLEEVMKSASFAFILVTHDRYFLESCTNRIVELSRQFPDGFLKINGNYSIFLEEREAFLSGQAKLEQSLANKLRRETEWLRRGPKARTTKAKFRIDDAERLQEELADVKQRNQQRGSVGIDFNASDRKTKRLMVVKEISKTLGGKQLFENLSFLLTPGTRLGLLGRNGSGKSTLMQILQGTLNADTGVVEPADQLRIVYFDQKRKQVDPDLPLRVALSPAGDSVVYRGRSIHVASWAQRFLFRTDQLETPVKNLSGGEQARILIAQLMLQEADLLLLDEPTNDLDIASLEVLEQSLTEFPGAVMMVSHDRYLLDRISTAVIGLGEGGADIYADYEQWLQAQNKPLEEEKATKSKKEKPRKQAAKKLSYKEQKELDGIEEAIHEAEAHLESCQAVLDQPEVSSDPEALTKACEVLDGAQAAVNQLYHRWEELEALKASLEN